MSTNLRKFRFPKHMLATKTGPGGMTLTFVDVRNIAATLDDLCPGWHSSTSLQHTGTEYFATVTLAVDEVTRSDVGSGDTPPDAQNQAFRRAAAQHGLGAYLWLDVRYESSLEAPAPSAPTPSKKTQPYVDPRDQDNLWDTSTGEPGEADLPRLLRLFEQAMSGDDVDPAMVAWVDSLRQRNASSGNAMSPKQYGYVSSLIDNAFSEPYDVDHTEILTCLMGTTTNRENAPGWKTAGSKDYPALIDWLTSDREGEDAQMLEYVVSVIAAVKHTE